MESINNYPVNPEAIKTLPARFVNRYKLLPIDVTVETLTIATPQSPDMQTINEIGLLLSKKIKLIIVPSHEIEEAIKKYYGLGTIESIVSDNRGQTLNTEFGSEFGTKFRIQGLTPDITSLSNEAPVIKLVNAIIREAVEREASDIHLEPYEKNIILRYRIDGVLYDISSPPPHLYPAIVSRIKIMAQMNIAEKRLPQDGRIQVKIHNKDIDLRVSTLPTIYNECVSIRVLDKGMLFLNIETIGLADAILSKYQQLIHRSNGIILVTGPTGSGKTTTLYASLARISSSEKKIITVEDPVEYNLQRISQIQIKPEIGLTFASGLRSILRHNPDILMVGEIRDKETAEVAIQSALTGHLILSTMHTNDSATAIARLQDMGIEDFLISSTLIGVLAQRLVRTICSNCKGTGCKECNSTGVGVGSKPTLSCKECNNTGFKGRTGIFELLSVSPRIKRLIVDRVDSSRIKVAAIEEGMVTLLEQGEEKIAARITTREEVLRVIQG
ncbi:type II/IV secretion system protein [Candidatus Desantisbacteria bacterium]|nr:type II/IV secretion system protein [Candidatus Desantisbacteria bacterium]